MRHRQTFLPAFVIAAVLANPALAQEDDDNAIIVTAQRNNATEVINGGNAGVLGDKPAEDLPFRPANGAVLERAPSARRPDLVELPCKDPKSVSQPFSFSGLLHQQGLPNHALPELLLESVGADQVKVRFAKVNLNDVVARVVSARHRVVANAIVGVMPPRARVTRHAAVDAPVLLVQGPRHRFKRRVT